MHDLRMYVRAFYFTFNDYDNFFFTHQICPALGEPADDRMVRQAEIPSLRRSNERERRVSQSCTASFQSGLRKSSAFIGIRKSSTQFPPHISFIVITVTVLRFVTVRGPNLRRKAGRRPFVYSLSPSSCIVLLVAY